MSAQYKVVILGTGPAGLTAAIYLARASVVPIVFSGPQPGGQLSTTTEVGNYPGFVEDIQGPELMDRMRKQAERYGTKFIEEEISSVDFTKKPFSLKTSTQTVMADSVIIATGASAKWLGLDSEQKLRGKGVSACATCDGFFFKDKDVVVVGGGDTAMEEATFLTKFAKKVTIIARGSEGNLKASKFMEERAIKDSKISFIYSSEVIEVIGDNKVDSVKIKNNENGKEKVIKIDGLFIAIGHKPNTDFLGDQLELDKGYIKVKDNTKTSVPGIFTGGDVHDWRYRQAVTAAGFGCMAALDVERYLEGIF